jgi:hypothetical protein
MWPALSARRDAGAILALTLVLLGMVTLLALATVRGALEGRRLQSYQEEQMRLFYLAASALAQAERRVLALDRLLMDLPQASRGRWFRLDCRSEQAPPGWRDGLCLSPTGYETWPPCRRSARIALLPGLDDDCRRAPSALGPDPQFRVELLEAGEDGGDEARASPRLYRIIVRVRSSGRAVRLTVRGYWRVGADGGERLAWGVLS